MPEVSPQAIKEFVIEILKVSGSSYREVDEHLLMAEVMVTIPPLFFEPARLEKQTLNLVFDPEVASNYPGAELIVQRSYRLNWFIEGMKERGNYTLQSFPYDLEPIKAQQEIKKLLPPSKQEFRFHQPVLRIHPHLLVNYQLSYQTDQLWEELISLGMDMVTGEIFPDFLSFLMKTRPTLKIPAQGIEEQKFTLETAFTRLNKYIQSIVNKKDPAWINEARSSYEEELFCLYQYYQEDKRDPQDFKSRAEELYEKFRPRVLVHLLNVGLLYLPEVIYSLRSPAGKKLPNLRYRPLLKAVEWMGSSSPK
jgi:hypothetical protein